MHRTPLLAVVALAALAAHLAAAQAPATAARRGALPEGDVHVDAGTVTYDASTGSFLVEDGAVLRRGTVVLRARTARYDPETGQVVATGGVLLTDATRAVAADGVTAVLGGPFEAQDVVAFLKSGPVELGGAESIDAARGLGQNRLVFSGKSLQGDPSGRLKLSGARLTLCDCGAGRAPSWEIRAANAEIIAGKRATLSWPVVYVTPRFLFVDHPVPVLPLPWLYLPLGERQTGLLVPQLVSSGATRFAVDVPLFVTLGRSADLTFTPGYAFGPGSAAVDKGKPAVRGPTARLEGRWAPAVGAAGRAELTWLRDLDAEPGGESGSRYAVALAHAQRFSERTSLRADLALYSDPLLARDFSTDILARGTSYRRSDLVIEHARDALVLEAGASYLQPFLVSPEGYGLFGRDVDELHRWPWASATLLPSFLGPLRVEGRAGAARFAPAASLDGGTLRGLVADGAAGVPYELPRPSGVDRVLRPGASRGDVGLEVAAPLQLGNALVVEPFVRGAALGYAFEDGTDPAMQAWGVAGARLETTFGRAFGAIRHRVTPWVEWRLGSESAGNADLPAAYDSLDRVERSSLVTPAGAPGPVELPLPILSAAPRGRFQQLRAAVDTRLSLRGADVLRLELGQDYDVETGRLAETFTSGELRAGRFSADAAARFLAFGGRKEPVPLTGVPRLPSSPLDRLTELRAFGSVSDRRGDALRLGLLSIGRGASGSLVAGLDPLFDLRPAPLEAVAQGNAGVTARLGGATATYDVLFPGRPVVRSCPDRTREVGALHIQQHVATFAWQSPCRCFRVAASLTLNDCGGFTPRMMIDLAPVGSTLAGASR
ncbi:LPS-assembly protein LptD [Anaeromyxobacter sp. SG17]|uniref:LPS-assembly protein LptD n=1 Tax=Anaeromyxobacter sp. SG17 TaxID=2925405 RepID=UPI001F569F86|nr:LPS-assembly protein LptD [Anaeromyxobacter sp. SG17]